MKELPIKPDLFGRAIAGTSKMLECTDRHDRVVLVHRLMAYPALLTNPQPRARTSGNVLELRLAQCEAGSSLHLRVGQRPFQQAAPTASDIEEVTRARYSGSVEVVIDLAPLSCQQVVGVVALAPQGA